MRPVGLFSTSTRSPGAGRAASEIAAGQHDLGVPPLISLYALPDGLARLVARLCWIWLGSIWPIGNPHRSTSYPACGPCALLFGRAASADGTLEIGPNRLVLADDPVAELKFIEHMGRD